MLYFLLCLVEIIFDAFQRSKPPLFKNEEERLAYLEQEARKRKQQRKEWHDNWMNVERPKLIREAGLDPNNPEDVKAWKAQRKAENKIKRAAELKQRQHTEYESNTCSSSYSSDSDSQSESYTWTDEEYERYLESESNKGPGEKFIDFLLWHP